MILNELNQPRMGKALPFLMACILIVSAACVLPGAASPHWEIKGRMSEACTCQVPCGCNFHQGPSPHHYCWSIAAFQILSGHYGAVDLSGLRLVRAHGNRSIVWYLDSRSAPSQAAALEAIAAHISGLPKLRVEKAVISQTMRNHTFQVKIGNLGGFDADTIIGRDGKSPIVVENMTAWNVDHDIKGKTNWLRYRDRSGNQFDLRDTNANQGIFDWTDHTASYF